MPYLTERKFSNTLDVPVNLPSTEIKMGDWVVIATIKLVAPARLTYRMMNLNLIGSTFNVSNLIAANRIVPNFGLCYIGLFFNYISGDPSGIPALDVLYATGSGVIYRIASPIVTAQEGTYSWIAANNVQISDQNPLLTTSSSVDFTLSCVGQARIELDLTQ